MTKDMFSSISNYLEVLHIKGCVTSIDSDALENFQNLKELILPCSKNAQLDDTLNAAKALPTSKLETLVTDGVLTHEA